MMYKCPYPNCEFKSTSLSGLRNHYIRRHGLKWCPICKRNFKDLIKHLCVLSVACEKHKVLYGLLSRRRYNRSFVLEARELAEEVLKVED